MSSQHYQSQPIYHRRQNGMNSASSQQLQTIMSDIFQWKDKFDPNNEIFDHAFQCANQSYLLNNGSQTTEAKEEEPSPNVPFTADSVPITSRESETNYDPTQDSQYMSAMNCAVKKSGLNTTAPAFVPYSPPKQSPKPVKKRGNLNKKVPDLDVIIEESALQRQIFLPNYSNQVGVPMVAVPIAIPLSTACPVSNFVHIITANQSVPICVTQPTRVTPPKNVAKTEQKNCECKDVFEPKFNNHAKGNFFIARPMTVKMIELCPQPFHAHRRNDDKLAFGYFKESVAMQINDKQIRIINGDIIAINIDLNFKNGDIMYLIAGENDIEHRGAVKWKIMAFMTANEIRNKYGLSKLPKSSRNMRGFPFALAMPPTNVPMHEVRRIINQTKYKSLPCKNPNVNRKNKRQNQVLLPVTRISESDLKNCIEQSWNNGVNVPCVVVKGNAQWIEWKKFVKIYDSYRKCEQWIGISLKYHVSNRQWSICCMEYDLGRIYYQHRLVGMNHKFCYSYQDLVGYVTTVLKIE